MREPKFKHITQGFQEMKESVKIRTETPELPFGIKKLDDLTYGIRRGRLTVISSRTSECKTTLSLQTAVRLADMNKKVVYISLEDDLAQLTERIFCNTQMVPNDALMRGKWTEEYETKYQMALKLTKNIDLRIMHDFGYSWAEFSSLINKVDKPDVVFLDYINLIDSYGNKHQTISDFVKKCKAFSLHNNIAIVLNAQINRTGAEEKRPRPHHLKDSGSLEENCDLLLINYYPARYDGKGYDGKQHDEDYLEIEVAKNKVGRIGIVSTNFIPQFYLIKGWEIDNQD